MDRKQERLLFLFIIAILVIVIINLSINSSSTTLVDSSGSNLLNQIEKIINDNYYIDPPKNSELVEGAARGMVASLNDPYSSFVTKKELLERQQSLAHKYGGIGAYISIENDMPVIIKLIPDSPAKKNSLLPGDIILEVDSKDTKGLELEKVTGMIKGEPGTIVTLKIKREGFNEPLIKKITREEIKLQMVKTAELTNNVFYIKIEDFGDNTADTVKNELVKATKKYKGAVIDLRGNPGGYLSEVIDLLNYFFNNKILLNTRGRNRSFNETFISKNMKVIPDNFKLVVLVDGATASAAEIFTAVMKDYKRAKIIGEKTYGKGVVQQVFQLNDGSAIFLTISQYFSPNDYVIHKKGIEPDIVVKNYEYSDNEITTISLLERRGILYQYIQKYGSNNREVLYKEIKNLLNKEKLYLSDFSIRYLVYQLIQFYGEEKIFDLEFDYQLQKALDQF